MTNGGGEKKGKHDEMWKTCKLASSTLKQRLQSNYRLTDRKLNHASEERHTGKLINLNTATNVLTAVISLVLFPCISPSVQHKLRKRASVKGHLN